MYNDLKLENILVGDSNSSCPQSLNDIKLIDFGLCSEYRDKTGMHIAFGETSEFTGNMAMGSANALDFKTLSRRDDFISLSYLLVYLATGNLEFVTQELASMSQQ